MRPLRALALAALAATPAAAGGIFDYEGKAIDENGWTIRLRAWESIQDAAVQDSTDTQQGSVIEFDEDTDLDRRLYIPEVEFEIRYDEIAVHIGAWRASDSERGQFYEDEGFDGHVFAAGDRAHQRFRVTQGTLHFEWIPLDLGSERKFGFELGFIVGARITRMEASFRDSASGEHFRSTSTAALPDLGLTLCVGFLNIFQIEAWGSGMAFDVSGWDYRWINAGGELRVFLDSHFYLGGGYRFSTGSIERGDSDDDGRLLEYTWHGWEATIGFVF
jgi:hypothetical protein